MSLCARLIKDDAPSYSPALKHHVLVATSVNACLLKQCAQRKLTTSSVAPAQALCEAQDCGATWLAPKEGWGSVLGCTDGTMRQLHTAAIHTRRLPR